MSALKDKPGQILLSSLFVEPEMSENLHKFLKFLPSDFEFVTEAGNKK